MSPELAGELVRSLMERHPLPWRIEHDWTPEVIDGNDRLVLGLVCVDEANELISLANELAFYDAQNKTDVRKMLLEHGIED